MKEQKTGNEFINPKEIISKLEIAIGMSVADFGCGTGYFTFPLAQKVGAAGNVFALDILKDKLEAISSEAKILGLNNISIRRANLELAGGSKLEGNSLEWVFLVNMLFQNKNKEVIVAEAARVLKPSGKILIIEWNEEISSFGPAKDLRVTKEEISQIAQKNNLKILENLEISKTHFGVILGK